MIRIFVSALIAFVLVAFVNGTTYLSCVYAQDSETQATPVNRSDTQTPIDSSGSTDKVTGTQVEGENGSVAETDESEETKVLPDSNTNEPVFREDFAPENLPESDIDSYSPWRGVVGAFFVLALLFVAVWILKKVARPNLDFTINRRMRVLETLSLGMGRQVILIQIGGRILILGSTQSGLVLLDTMQVDEVSELTKSNFEHVEEGTLEVPHEISSNREAVSSFSDKLEEIKRRLNSVKSDDE